MCDVVLCWCCVGVVLLVVVVVVYVVQHAGKTWKKPYVDFRHASVCAFRTFPCVPATGPHEKTCVRGAGTHGDVLNVHTEAF